jgi:tetratricopeptide (TPR) repeat protein
LNQDKLIAKGKEYYRLGIAKIEKSKGEGEYNALRELAIQAAEIGEYAEAINVWGKVLELKANDAVAFMNMGFAFLMMKQYDKAAEHSKKAMDLDPDFREAALNYSAAELIAGDVKKAISTLENILKNNTDYPPAMGRLAAACMIDGRKEEGLRYLDRLITKGFDCSSMMEEQSRAFLSEGRIEQAVLLLQAVLEKGLSNISTHALLAECQQKMKCSTSVSEQIDPSCILPGPAAGMEATAQADRLKVNGKNSDISRRRTQTDADYSSADMAEEKRLALRAGEMGGTRQGARGGTIGSSLRSK